MNCEFEYVGSFRKCEPITLSTGGLISAGIMATGETAQGIAAAKTNARGSRLAHRQHEWAMKDAEIERAWQEKIQDKMNDWNLEQWNRQNDWNLEQWNRQNEYDSTAAQLKRWTDAGLNPLAFQQQGGSPSMQADALESAGVGSAQAGLGGLPHFENPLQGAAQMGSEFSQFLTAQYERSKLKQEIFKTQSETIRQNIDNMIRTFNMKNEIDFAGIQVRVAGQTIKESEAREDVAWKTAANLNVQQKLNMKFLSQADVDLDLKKIQRYIQEHSKNYQVKQYAENLLYTIVQRYGQRQDNINKFYEGEMLRNRNIPWKELLDEKGYGEQTYDQRELINQDSQNQSRALQEIGKTKTPLLYGIDKGIDTLQGIVDVFNGVCDNIQKFGVGKRGLRSSPVSSQNPTATLQDYYREYGTKPYTPWSNR